VATELQNEGEITMAEKLEVLFDTEKETKNTVRFTEVPGDGAPQVGTIYVQNWALKKLGGPKKIKVTIEAVE
jgi:archaellum component FlaG (FlaF/FlaG flagellin family)